MTKDTNATGGAAIKRYKIGYHTDEWGVRSSTPGGITDPSGQWVLYKDHLAALAHHGQAPAQAALAARAPADSALKDHQIAALVNELRDIAIQYYGTQQLRERIARAVIPALKAQADSVLEDAARLEFEMQHGSAIDAARKQGANHD